MPNMAIKKIVIVGAGISGLAVAFRLQQQLPDADITVLEQNNRPGGAAWTLRADGFQLEIGPNGFLDTKPTTVALAQDVGLGNALVAASDAAAKNRFLFLDNQLKKLPGGLFDFLRSDLLSWRGKLAFFLERFRKANNSGDESIAAFARRRAGKEAALFADALVTGIYAGDPSLLSLAACFPRVAALERQYGSVLKGFAQSARQQRREARARGDVTQRPGKMWSFQDGLRRLVETLAGQLPRPVVYGISVRRLERGGALSRWIVHGEGESRWEADAVILTCPAHQQAGILADVDPLLAEEIGAIAYNRVAVVGLGYRREDVPGRLDGFGFIAPQHTRRDLLGVQWCSSIFPGRAPEGSVLLRALCGGWHRADVVGWADDRLLSAMRAELRLALGITAPPIFHRIIRWERAIPQYHLGHLERLDRIAQRLKHQAGLFLGGNAYHGVALNDCTEQGLVLAARVTDYLAAK